MTSNFTHRDKTDKDSYCLLACVCLCEWVWERERSEWLGTTHILNSWYDQQNSSSHNNFYDRTWSHQSCIGLRGPTRSLSKSRQNPTNQSAEAYFLHAAYNSQTGRGWDDPTANQKGGAGKASMGKNVTGRSHIFRRTCGCRVGRWFKPVFDQGQRPWTQKSRFCNRLPAKKRIHTVSTSGREKTKYKWRFDETGVSSLILLNSI